MEKLAFTSKPFHVNDDTCVDVKADSHGVVLGQQGAAWMHNLHLTDATADGIADALKAGASASRTAQQAAP
jgi:hypothetical protein